MKNILAVLTVLLALGLTGSALAQATNPQGVSGEFTSVGGQENEHIVFIKRVVDNGRDKNAKYLYKFSVSDTCRIVLSSDGSDGRFYDPAAVGSPYDDYVINYIPLRANIDYSISCNAEYLKIYRAGASVTLTYSGVVEYE